MFHIFLCSDASALHKHTYVLLADIYIMPVLHRIPNFGTFGIRPYNFRSFPSVINIRYMAMFNCNFWIIFYYSEYFPFIQISSVHFRICLLNSEVHIIVLTWLCCHMYFFLLLSVFLPYSESVCNILNLFAIFWIRLPNT
jgi:hypothetical protein